MKAILTLGIVLGLMMTFANLEVTAQRKIVVFDAEQHEKNIEICTQNLIAIGKSIQVYQKETGDYPEWLSDLHHPKYLPDPDILICPADRLGGRAVFARNIDPKIPVSYGYQFHPEYRGDRITDRRLIYGDVIPLVRCRHHVNPEFHCLNLSFSYKIARSISFWELQPEQLYETDAEAVAALEAGLQRQPDNASLSCYVYPALARLYIKIDREGDIDNLINQFKSVMDPDYDRDYFALADMLEMMDRNEELLQMFMELEKKHPKDRSVHRNLAEIYQKLGNTKLAKEYQLKAEPMLAMIGQPVPDFTATDLDGNPISLEQYRGKVVLLDFWAVWCGPCIAEMPNVKRVYNNYKDEGFDIIGISLDIDEARLRNYLKENDISWQQVFSGEGWQSPVSQQYDIRAIPAQWLIDRDGTLISNRARGKALERLVTDALKK
jgi:peroxiredoxin